MWREIAGGGGITGGGGANPNRFNQNGILPKAPPAQRTSVRTKNCQDFRLIYSFGYTIYNILTKKRMIDGDRPKPYVQLKLPVSRSALYSERFVIYIGNMAYGNLILHGFSSHT